MTVLPNLDYGDVVYESATKPLFHKLDVIYHYHTAIQFVSGAFFFLYCNQYSLIN